MTKIINEVPTVKRFIDVGGREHGSRLDAINANIRHRDQQISYSVRKEMSERLAKGMNIYIHSADIKIEQIVNYFLETDLIKANKKIKELIVKAENQYEKDYPNTPLI